MNLYAETSAVLAWLFGESNARRVRAALADAAVVVASELTLIEVERVLHRAVALGETSETTAGDCRAQLGAAASHWQMLALDAEVIARAKRPFPAEPLRTLDALHLASALTARAALPGLELLSLDHRLRDSAQQLGFRPVPR